MGKPTAEMAPRVLRADECMPEVWNTEQDGTAPPLALQADDCMPGIFATHTETENLMADRHHSIRRSLSPRHLQRASSRPRHSRRSRCSDSGRWWFSKFGHKWAGLESEGENLGNRIQAFTKKYQSSNGFSATMQQLVGYTYTCLNTAGDVESQAPSTAKTLASESHDLIQRLKAFFAMYKGEADFNKTMQHIVGLTSKLALESGALDELN